jgi:hypothetical protein
MVKKGFNTSARAQKFNPRVYTNTEHQSFLLNMQSKGVLHYRYQWLENGTFIQFEQNRSKQGIAKLNIAKTERTFPPPKKIKMAPRKLEQET